MSSQKVAAVMNSIVKVHIIYGVAEGQATARQFKQTLRTAGFETVDNIGDADIIFAHSGGCYFVPGNTTAKLILLVGIPYWPNRSIFTSMRKKTWLEFTSRSKEGHLSWWLKRMVWHTIYIFNIKNNYRQWKARRKTTVWEVAQAIIIRNELDVYCTPEMSLLPFKNRVEFITLPGMHDDCWDNPKPYIEIMRRYG